MRKVNADLWFCRTDVIIHLLDLHINSGVDDPCDLKPKGKGGIKYEMNQSVLDKLGAVGSFLAAAACPACFPLLGIVGSAVGLGIFKPFEGAVFYIFQGLVLLGLLGNISAYFNHNKIIPLLIGVASPILIFFSLYGIYLTWVLYTGLFGMMAAAILNFFAIKRCQIKVNGPSLL